MKELRNLAIQFGVGNSPLYHQLNEPESKTKVRDGTIEHSNDRMLEHVSYCFEDRMVPFITTCGITA